MEESLKPPSKSTKLVKSKANFSPDELAGLLENIAARMRAGEITLGSGESSVTMSMPPLMKTTLQLTDSTKRSGIERELELEISWYVDEHGAPVDKPRPASGFEIS